MTLERQFELRKSDIEEIFYLLDFIVKIESHKNVPLIDTTTGNTLTISQEMQCAFKAEFLLLLYNIVESTTKSGNPFRHNWQRKTVSSSMEQSEREQEPRISR